MEKKNINAKLECLEDFDDISEIMLKLDVVIFMLLNCEIHNIIEEKCEKRGVIKYVFKKLLKLFSIPRQIYDAAYYKLLNYTRNFDEKLANEYEQLLIEHYNKFEGNNYE